MNKFNLGVLFSAPAVAALTMASYANIADFYRPQPEESIVQTYTGKFIGPFENDYVENNKFGLDEEGVKLKETLNRLALSWGIDFNLCIFYDFAKDKFWLDFRWVNLPDCDAKNYYKKQATIDWCAESFMKYISNHYPLKVKLWNSNYAEEGNSLGWIIRRHIFRSISENLNDLNSLVSKFASNNIQVIRRKV